MASYSALPSTARTATEPSDDVHPGSPLLSGSRRGSLPDRPFDDSDDDLHGELKDGRYGGGSATVFSSVSNLANTILGTGMLAFPSAFAQVGIVPGIISCAFSGFMAFSGLHLLSVCAAKVQPKRKSSFNAVSLLTFGKFATVFFDLAIAIKCFGVSISYLIIIKTLTPQALTTLYELIRPGENSPALLKSGPVWLLVSMAVNIPLAFFKRLDSLRFTSQAALVFVLYMLAIVVVFYFHRPGDMDPAGEIEYFRWSHSAIGSFPVQVFAYTCAQNLFPVFNELKNNTQRRMNIVVATSIGSATAIYEILAIAGYLTFGNNVGSNILAMYPNSSLFVALGRLGIVIMVLFSYPLQAHPARAALDKVLTTLIMHYRVKSASTETKKLRASIAGEENFNDDDDGMSDIEGELSDGHEEEHLAVKAAAKDMSRTRFIILTACILIGGLITALLVDELETVLSFVGATGSTIISFILPGLFYYTLFRRNEESPQWKTYGALALAVYGVAVMAFCLTYNIVNLTQGATLTH